MKRALTAIAGYLLLLTSITAQENQDLWVSIGTDSLPAVQKELGNKFSLQETQEGVSLIQISPEELEYLSHIMHEVMGRGSQNTQLPIPVSV